MTTGRTERRSAAASCASYMTDQPAVTLIAASRYDGTDLSAGQILNRWEGGYGVSKNNVSADQNEQVEFVYSALYNICFNLQVRASCDQLLTLCLILVDSGTRPEKKSHQDRWS